MLTPDEITALKAENAAWFASLGHISNRGPRPGQGACLKRGFDSAAAARADAEGANFRVGTYLCPIDGKYHVKNLDKS